jgi:hypothetical protein
MTTKDTKKYRLYHKAKLGRMIHGDSLDLLKEQKKEILI